MEAKYLNRIAVIPDLMLNGKHNNGKDICTSWETYINLRELFKFHPFVLKSEIPKFDDLESHIIHENCYPKELIDNHSTLIIRKHLKYPNYYRLIDIINNPRHVEVLENLFNYSENMKNKAQIVINKLQNYHCLHVRRGDKLNWKQCPGLNKVTQPKKIFKFLKKHIDLKEYIYND